MVEQKHLKLSALALRAATLLQGSLVNHLSIFIAQTQVLYAAESVMSCISPGILELSQQLRRS